MVGNFSITLKVEGDRIREATANPGYLHRGFEKLMEYRTWIQNFPLVCRINVVEPDHMELMYAMAVEKLANLEVPERAQYIRSIFLELSRVASHLFGLWAYANMLGFDTVAQWAMYHRDLVLDLFEELTGGRVYHIYIWPGGVRRDFPEGFQEKIVNTLHSIGGCVPDYDDIFFQLTGSSPSGQKDWESHAGRGYGPGRHGPGPTGHRDEIRYPEGGTLRRLPPGPLGGPDQGGGRRLLADLGNPGRDDRERPYDLQAAG